MIGRTILVNGLRVHYLSGGSEKKPAVVLLHGYGMDSSVHKSLGQLLSEDYFVIIPDLPGFGGSDKIKGASFFWFAYLLNDFLREIDISVVTLVAHSMGGGVAIEYARLLPEKVDKLVLVDSVGAPIKRSLLGWAFAAMRKTFRSLSNPLVAAKVVTTFALNCLRRPIWMWKTFRMTVNADLLEELSQIEVETYVVWAESDEYYPLSACVRICSTLSVEPIIVRGAGHDWMILKPGEASRVIGSLL